MGILNIREGKRAGARLVVGISGISGSGKTFTALQLAYGLANFNSRKVGLLDTENRRGSLYANALKNDKGEVQPFLIGDLDAPFSPGRYKEAILEFQAAGVEVLVIDSVTHEWEGIGGCHDIASPPGSNLKVKRWNEAKAEHKSFMNTLLQSDMHIIACIRARNRTEIRMVNGKAEYIPQGVLPIQEENFMFEMTASMMMWGAGKNQDVLKCPDELAAILGRGQGYITAADGQALRAWVDGAEPVNAEVERARNLLRTTTENGMAALQKAWSALPEPMRQTISADGRCPQDLKASAEEFDRQRAGAKTAAADVANINEVVSGAA